MTRFHGSRQNIRTNNISGCRPARHPKGIRCPSHHTRPSRTARTIPVFGRNFLYPVEMRGRLPLWLRWLPLRLLWLLLLLLRQRLLRLLLRLLLLLRRRRLPRFPHLYRWLSLRLRLQPLLSLPLRFGRSLCRPRRRAKTGRRPRPKRLGLKLRWLPLFWLLSSGTRRPARGDMVVVWRPGKFVSFGGLRLWLRLWLGVPPARST